MESQGHRLVPVWVYLAGFVVLGSSLSFSGAALSHLRDRVGTDDGGISLIFVGSSTGYMFGSFLGGRALDRGRGHRTWATCMIIAIAMITLVSQIRDLTALVGAFVILGTVSGVADVSGNTLVVWSRPEAPGSALNALHALFGVGALTAPLMTNRAIAWSGSLWPIVVPLGLLSAVCCVKLLTTPAPMKTRTIAERAEAPADAASLRRSQLAVVSLFFFVYVSLEIGFANWIHTYVEQIRYGGANTATGITAIFWVGFALGRVASIGLARRFSAGWMLVWSMSVALLSSTALVLVNGGNVGLWIVSFLFGLSIAPQFASMIAYAEAHFVLSGAATSAFIGAAGLAGLVMPWSLGQLFDARGPGVLPPVTLGACIATVAVGLWVRHMVTTATDQRPPVTSMNAPVT